VSASAAIGATKIPELLPVAAQLYHRLILVVAPPGGGKTAALRTVQTRTGAPLLNVSLHLSERLLELTERRRKLQASRILDRLVSHAAGSADISEADGAVLLLDNIELLFETSLALDPLRLLETTSRDATLVVAWPGEVCDGWLTYAHPGHREYRRYPVGDLIIVEAGAG
jgi:hypothetical protein